VSEAAGAGRGATRRRWLIAAGAAWLLGAVGVFAFHGWLLDELVEQAQRRGVALSGCQLDLGWSQIGLDRCEFTLQPDGRVASAALTNVAVSGSVDRLEIELDGLTPARARVLGAHALLSGEPRVRELLGPGATGNLRALEWPVDVEQSAVSLQLDARGPQVLALSELSFDSRTQRLGSRFEIVRRAHGQLALGPEGLEVTLGDPIRPEVRLIVRVLAKAERVDISLDLRRVPLRSLEGPWLQMTDALRPVELEGRIFASVPLGLSMEVPGGDLNLTLHGLQFPVPRELDGLIYGSPPKLSGKFSMSRTFDRVTIPDLSFLTGELAMRGDAELQWLGQGLAIKSRTSGPLPCRAIADSAATAHADSPLGTLAGLFARRALTGSVDIIAAIEAHTSDLEHARVFTSIGVGCGLEPLPIDLNVSRELLDRLPIDALQALPRPVGPVRSPKSRTRKGRQGSSPTLLDDSSDTP
jgi:ADP-dependent NAD(P)H-hydrate dehydratase / NAD(P)H-hydrate epimerase